MFSSGVPASKRRSWRESRVAARRTSSISSSSVSTIGSRISRSPLRSLTQTTEFPRTWMSLISSSSSNGCSRPRPRTWAIAAEVISTSSNTVNTERPSDRRAADNRRSSACTAVRAKLCSSSFVGSAILRARRSRRSSARTSPSLDAKAFTNCRSIEDFCG